MKLCERTLLLSWGVPPLISGSAVVVGNLARQFSCEEMIVAGERPSESPPVPWRKEWPQIHYLVKDWPTRWRGKRWRRRIQFPLLLMRCIKLVRRHQCKSVLVIFPNEEFLLAGYLTASWMGAKLYPYFHNTYAENRKGLSLRFARWLQARVFSKAAHIFVMSEGMAELYRERYPDLQCTALVHSFNDPIPDFSPAPEPGSPLRFMICGSIWETCLDATVRFCDAISQIGDASLTFLTGAPRTFLHEMGLLRDGVKYVTAPHGEVITRLKEADIVVLPHGFSGGLSPEEYRTIFPTRTIEYLICERPILAHTPPDCYLTRFLKAHACALIVDEPSIPALLEAIRRLRADARLRSDLVRNALRTAAIFHAPRVAAALRARLQPS